jgi:hypothetical protein
MATCHTRVNWRVGWLMNSRVYLLFSPLRPSVLLHLLLRLKFSYSSDELWMWIDKSTHSSVRWDHPSVSVCSGDQSLATLQIIQCIAVCHTRVGWRADWLMNSRVYLLFRSTLNFQVHLTSRKEGRPFFDLVGRFDRAVLTRKGRFWPGRFDQGGRFDWAILTRKGRFWPDRTDRFD